MKSLVQLFLAVQCALFAVAAGAHFGVYTDMNDPGASTAETVIAAVLLIGLALTFSRTADIRAVALGVQGFALLGTLIGITLVLTVGPTKTFDVTVHGLMLALLLTGLAVTSRAPRARQHARLA